MAATGAANIVTLINSANLYVENQDYLSSAGSAASVLTITASATGTYNGSDITNNNSFRGARFFAVFSTIAATCTVRFSLQSKDPLSGLYITGATASFDGLTTGNTNTVFAFNVYPGLNAAVQSQEVNVNECISPTMRIIASISATASAGSPACTLQTGLSRLI
jgi:hypothetical protein